MEEKGRIDTLDDTHVIQIWDRDAEGGEEATYIPSLAPEHLKAVAHTDSKVRQTVTYIVVGVFVFLVLSRVLWIPLHLGTADDMDRVFDPMWNTTLGLLGGLVGYFLGQRSGGSGGNSGGTSGSGSS
jgi:uncharacterized membrane protein YgcG